MKKIIIFAFVIALAFSLCACACSKEAIDPVGTTDAATEPTTEPTLSPEELFMQSLPEKLRLPLVLYYSEGLTYAEIAQTLRLPMATVRGRIHRAKGQLRKELGAE